MNKRYLIRPILLGLTFTLFNATVLAERYYVEEDSFGNFDAIKAEEQPQEQTEQALEKEKVLESPNSEQTSTANDNSESEPSDIVTSAEPEKKAQKSILVVKGTEALLSKDALPTENEATPEVELVTENSLPQPAATSELVSQAPDSSGVTVPEVDQVNAESLTVTSTPKSLDEKDIEAVTVSSKKRKLSKFERIFLESEGQNPYDATVIDEAEYIDAQDLLEGKGVSDNERPFFITRDPSGNEFVTVYSPTVAREQREKAKQALKFSEATIYTPEDSSKGAKFSIPSNADPIALQILSSGDGDLTESYFESFSKTCCERLPRNYIKKLFFNKSTLLEVSRDLLSFRFSEGDSRYLMFKLPEFKENFALQVRSFIRKYKDQGVNQGIFFPQIVTLSEKFQVLRIISDPVMEYTPETWSGYGYVEGVFEIDREQENEVYVLVHTTNDALRKRSEFDHPKAPATIRHMTSGSLGVKPVRTASLK